VILADEIRAFAVSSYIMPARDKGSAVSSHVTIVSGDIVRQLKLQQRVPAVCGALDGHKFLNENSLKLVKRTGPRQGMTATWKILV
jgi:5-methylcytosine-specific restriction enzyme B